ncbi:MAG: 2-oxoglutarate dehydrogenase E1 component [Phycisphaerales bacterium]|jgi:2-oxoglutarate dehydrogenase E1 component
MNDTTPRPVPASVNGWNAEYLDAEYSRFRADPSSVPADMAAFLRGFDLGLDGAAPAGGAASGSSFDEHVVDLINAYREQGHLAAKLDPFDRERPRPATLALAPHGLADADLSRPVNGAQVGLPDGATLRDLVAHLERTYCRSIGIEFMHIRSDAERAWFLANYEKFGGMRTPSKQEQLRVLDQLTRGECYEAFAQKRYGSEKRFSLEGGISLIPMLDQMIERAGGLGVEEIVVGMAHRGRVNVLINIMGKSYEQVFTEFEDNWEAGFADGGGDVKYHRGYSGTRALSTGQTMHLAMASNPSHLEAANGVVLGRCRAKQRVRGDVERRRVVPLLMHGDAAVAGQGVVAECLNMSQLEGYTVGGTVHVVINNLIGFTTLPEDGRSSTYCTDVAKMVDAPIFHVNGEDPEACVAVARLAIEYRQQFKKDVFVDMVCYRKYGHNEGDEPSFTQPILAALIKAKTATLQTYAERLLAEKVITSDDAKAIWDRLDAALDAAQTKAKKAPNVPLIDPGSARWAGMTGEFSFEPINTGVSKETLEEVCAALGHAPEGFAVNPKLVGLLKARAELVQTGHVSHSEGELLAIGTLLLEGLPVRLSGQDARRGTFTQRHAVIRDFTSGAPYVGLNNMREMGDPTKPPPQNQADGRSKQARFCVYDSPLSEYAIMAFEYGYSLADPNMLVMWEAQFGDFANTAQVIPDQFLSSGEIKWSRWSGLVLLLPHGYEGAGPEHSSAKLERFLQLCADDNMQVCYPSTGAQTFHMLRRQVKRGFRKPLIVMTPKSMLRVPTSTIDELMSGSFKDIFDDPAFDTKGGLDRKGVKRVVFCSGKVYHELAERVKVLAKKDIALVRIEQLYPFNTELAKSIIAKYPKGSEMVYAQEEPRNAGAYLYVADQFRTQLGIELKYIGREPSATPAVGSKRADKLHQEAVIAAAIGPKPKEAAKDAGGKKDAPAKAGVK